MNKILVVDDSMANINLVRAVMTSQGYEVIEAHNGNEALTVAKDEMPHLIIMDINMPTMDGIESMKQIRKLSTMKNVPIIAYTTYAFKGDRKNLLDEGFDDYLSKPASVSALIDVAQKNLLGKSLA